MGQQEAAEVIHRELLLESVDCRPPFIRVDARVVHEGVEAAVVLRELIGEGDDRRLARQVHEHQGDVGILGLLDDLALSGLAPALIAARQDDGASEAGEADGRRLPDARAGPGHDPDAVFDPRRPDGGHADTITHRELPVNGFAPPGVRWIGSDFCRGGSLRFPKNAVRNGRGLDRNHVVILLSGTGRSTTRLVPPSKGKISMRPALHVGAPSENRFRGRREGCPHSRGEGRRAGTTLQGQHGSDAEADGGCSCEPSPSLLPQFWLFWSCSHGSKTNLSRRSNPPEPRRVRARMGPARRVIPQLYRKEVSILRVGLPRPRVLPRPRTHLPLPYNRSFPRPRSLQG